MIRSLDLLESGIEKFIELFPFQLFCFSERRIVYLLPEVTIILILMLSKTGKENVSKDLLKFPSYSNGKKK